MVEPPGRAEPVKRPRTRRSAATPVEKGEARLAMKKVALDLFQRHGFRQVSVRELAGAMGLTSPTIYSHFRSKEDILLELIVDGHDEIDRLMESARTSVPDDDPVAQLAAHVYLLSRFHTDVNDLARVGRDVGYLPEPQREDILRRRRGLIRLFEDILVQGVAVRAFEVVEVRTTTRLLINMIASITGFFDPDRQMSRHDFAAHQTKLVLKAVSPGGCSVSDSAFRRLDARYTELREVSASLDDRVGQAAN